MSTDSRQHYAAAFHGEQYIAQWKPKVRRAHGVVVLASDNVYLYENLERGVPIVQTLDRDANLAAQRRMRTIATDPAWIGSSRSPAESNP